MHRFDMMATSKLANNILKSWNNDPKRETPQMERLAIKYAVEKMFEKRG